MDPKIDRDLQVKGSMSFEINFIENEKGQITFTVNGNSDQANMTVMFAMVGKRIEGVLANNKLEKDKKKKMSVGDMRTHVACAKLCNDVAATLGNLVYVEKMNPEVKAESKITIEPAMSGAKLKRV